MIKNKFIWAFLSLLACSSNSDQDIEQNISFEPAVARGEIENTLITEASGLAESINNPSMLWTHNDSGHDPKVFLMDDHGQGLVAFTLDSIENRDWEDMATGPGPKSGVNYIYIAETGDNQAVYDLKYIYRVPEPVIEDDTLITDFETIRFIYPDGRRDAECLLVDPESKDIYVISKREENVSVYIAKYPQSTTDTLTLEKLGPLPYNNIVAGDINADRSGILLKNYNTIMYWSIEEGEDIYDALTAEPQEIEYEAEPQGEAIAWKKDNSGFYTLSEERSGVEAVLYYYNKVN